MKKPLYSGICFLFSAALLFGATGCVPVPEDEKLPVYKKEDFPKSFLAIFQNSQNDTLGVYWLEMKYPEPDSNVKTTISFNSAGGPDKVEWTIIAKKKLNVHPDTLTETSGLLITDDYVSLDLPHKGPFISLTGANRLALYSDDEPGENHKSFGHQGTSESSGISIFRRSLVYNGETELNWHGQNLKTHFYQSKGAYEGKNFRNKYWYHTNLGFIRSEFTLPAQQQYSFGDKVMKLTILQLPKNSPSAAK